MAGAPSPTEQLKFLQKIQRLINEGGFVATYKFALLYAIADIAVEDGDDGYGQTTCAKIHCPLLGPDKTLFWNNGKFSHVISKHRTTSGGRPRDTKMS